MSSIISRTIDDAKRIKICTLLATNFSCREAAKYAGCSESGIRYLAKHDAEFAEQLRAAELAAESLPLESLRAAASKSVRAAIYLDQRNKPQRTVRRDPCIHPRRLCKRLYHRILRVIADPNTRCAVREVLRDTYHTVGLKPPARDPELRQNPLPVYRADADAWDLQDYSHDDELDRRSARDLAKQQAPKGSSAAAPPPPKSEKSDPQSSFAASAPPPLKSATEHDCPMAVERKAVVTQQHSDLRSPAPSARDLDSTTPAAEVAKGNSPDVTYADMLPVRMQSTLMGLSDPDYNKLMMTQLPKATDAVDLARCVRDKIGGTSIKGARRSPKVRAASAAAVSASSKPHCN